MIRNSSSKIFLVSIFVLFSFEVSTVSNIWSATLILEIYSKGELKRIDFKPGDIKKVGINDRSKETRVEVIIASNFHSLLEKLTKENIRKKIIIRTETEILFSGTIFDPLENGTMSFSCSSENEARAIIKKMGREPDYHLKLTPEELETSKKYKQPLNISLEKAIEAHSEQDFIKAEKFAKKAMEEAPNVPLPHQILSAIYYGQGKRKLALDELLTAEQLSKKEDLDRSPGIYLSIAGLYSDFNKFKQAIKYFQKVLSIYENNVLAHLGIAKVYEKMGKYDLALREYVLLSESGDEYSQKEGLEGIRRLEEKQK